MFSLVVIWFPMIQMTAVEDTLVLLNAAHINRSPKRLQGPAIRILGVFGNVQEVKEHVQEFFPKADIDFICVPLRKWFAVMHSTSSSDLELAHLSKLGKAYKDNATRHAEEFRENVAQGKTGAVNAQKNEQPVTEAPPSLPEPPKVPRTAEIRMQSYAVISILPETDLEDEALQQPGVIIWGTYPCEKTAKEAIKNDFSVVARDVNLDAVLMYEWTPLTGLNMQDVEEEFRDESLTEIIRARKQEGKQVEQYKDLCKQRGQDPNVLDISIARSEQDLILPPPLSEQTPLPNLAELPALETNC